MRIRHWGWLVFSPDFQKPKEGAVSKFDQVRQDLKLSGDEHLIRLESQLDDGSIAMLTGIFADLHNSSDEATEE